jgi:hypothetical protein
VGATAIADREPSEQGVQMLSCPIPHQPHDIGVPEETPELAQIEGAHLLANEAREFLTGCGFTDRAILLWAATYIAREGSGDVESFVAWIHEQQGTPVG